MERCSYVLKKKNRKCRMLVKSGQKFCGEHAIYDEQNEVKLPSCRTRMRFVKRARIVASSNSRRIIKNAGHYRTEHLAITDLLNNDKRWCLVDFGAGRAELSYWLAKLAPSCRFLLIERMGSRNKFDNKAQKELDLVSMERLRCSVEHLDLSKVEMLQVSFNKYYLRQL
ncbi:unnamed protein product [Gongylonema pulchrum]|uniref:tRNA:m(4)X modification enzyme TRM13 n=1 Tax=Gongylonema pulchrum TaxID=637853 RepID=A0A183E1E7_9BILA|nr:unnamed protein product [Gongylonema pulchrum]